MCALHPTIDFKKRLYMPTVLYVGHFSELMHNSFQAITFLQQKRTNSRNQIEQINTQ